VKGYRPTEDPNWHHEHVPTGETRQCETSGCKASWAVLCHNGRRRYCGACSAGRGREQDRHRKQVSRRDRRQAAYELMENFGLTVAEAAQARRNMSYRQYADFLAARERETHWEACRWDEDEESCY